MIHMNTFYLHITLTHVYVCMSAYNVEDKKKRSRSAGIVIVTVKQEKGKPTCLAEINFVFSQ